MFGKADLTHRCQQWTAPVLSKCMTMVQADAAVLVQQKEAAESAAKAQRASADAAALQARGDSAAAKAKMSMAEVLRKLSEVSIHPLMLLEPKCMSQVLACGQGQGLQG